MNNQKFSNDIYEGKTGKLMLQLSKTYKGDSRFKLDQKFKDDIEVEKLPQKFKQIAEKGILEAAQKKRKIKKDDKPLIIKRFEPGTASAQAIIKKAEGIKKYEEGLKRHKTKESKKHKLQSGINKIKKAQHLLNISNNGGTIQQKKHIQHKYNSQNPRFQMTVNGNRKQAFKSGEFKLFG